MNSRLLRASTILPGLALVLVTGGATFSQSSNWDSVSPNAPINLADDMSEVYGPAVPDSVPAEADKNVTGGATATASTSVASFAFDVPPDLSHPGAPIEVPATADETSAIEADDTSAADTTAAREPSAPTVRVIPLPTREDPGEAPPAPSGLGEAPVATVADVPEQTESTKETSAGADVRAPIPAPISQRPPESLMAPPTSRAAAVTPPPREGPDYFESSGPMRLDRANQVYGTGRERLDQANQPLWQASPPRLIGPAPSGDGLLFQQNWVEVQTPNGSRLVFR